MAKVSLFREAGLMKKAIIYIDHDSIILPLGCREATFVAQTGSAQKALFKLHYNLSAFKYQQFLRFVV